MSNYDLEAIEARAMMAREKEIEDATEDLEAQYIGMFWNRDARAHAAGVCTLTKGCAYSDHGMSQAS